MFINYESMSTNCGVEFWQESVNPLLMKSAKQGVWIQRVSHDLNKAEH